MNRAILTVRRAPVDEIDAKITEATRVRDSWCAALAVNPTDQAAMAGLLNGTQAVASLRFERDECIRTFFFRGSR